MDRIFIEELVVFAQIGVYDWEQQIKQKLVFDLEMAWDCQKAAETDDVQYCLNLCGSESIYFSLCPS